MNIINTLKKLPIDLGQGNYRRTTKGKEIAMDLIGNTCGTALDIGCREGDQTKRLELLGFEVTSIDIEKNFKRCIIMNANDPLSFSDESFDLIWCSEVIEHLDRPAESLSDLRQTLKPGGKLIKTTPNSFFWIFRIFNNFGIHPRKLQHSGHRHFFHYRDIQELFPAGTIYGFFPYILLKFRISRLVGILSPSFVVIERKP